MLLRAAIDPRQSNSMKEVSLVWFRLDLRLTDNPALVRALERSNAVIPVFIWAPEEEAPWAPGAASRWWLHHSLVELKAALEQRGSRLIVRHGASAETLLELAAESGAKSVFWNRRYEPASIARDKVVEQRLREGGIFAESCRGNLLFEPGTILNASGKPFQVFTPFWKACLAAQPGPEEPGTGSWPAAASEPLAKFNGDRRTQFAASDRLGERTSRNMATRRSRRVEANRLFFQTWRRGLLYRTRAAGSRGHLASIPASSFWRD